MDFISALSFGGRTLCVAAIFFLILNLLGSKFSSIVASPFCDFYDCQRFAHYLFQCASSVEVGHATCLVDLAVNQVGTPVFSVGLAFVGVFVWSAVEAWRQLGHSRQQDAAIDAVSALSILVKDVEQAILLFNSVVTESRALLARQALSAIHDVRRSAEEFSQRPGLTIGEVQRVVDNGIRTTVRQCMASIPPVITMDDVQRIVNQGMEAVVQRCLSAIPSPPAVDTRAIQLLVSRGVEAGVRQCMSAFPRQSVVSIDDIRRIVDQGIETAVHRRDSTTSITINDVQTIVDRGVERALQTCMDHVLQREAMRVSSEENMMARMVDSVCERIDLLQATSRRQEQPRPSQALSLSDVFRAPAPLTLAPLPVVQIPPPATFSFSTLTQVSTSPVGAEPWSYGSPAPAMELAPSSAPLAEEAMTTGVCDTAIPATSPVASEEAAQNRASQTPSHITVGDYYIAPVQDTAISTDNADGCAASSSVTHACSPEAAFREYRDVVLIEASDEYESGEQDLLAEDEEVEHQDELFCSRLSGLEEMLSLLSIDPDTMMGQEEQQLEEVRPSGQMEVDAQTEVPMAQSPAATPSEGVCDVQQTELAIVDADMSEVVAEEPVQSATDMAELAGGEPTSLVPASTPMVSEVSSPPSPGPAPAPVFTRIPTPAPILVAAEPAAFSRPAPTPSPEPVSSATSAPVPAPVREQEPASGRTIMPLPARRRRAANVVVPAAPTWDPSTETTSAVESSSGDQTSSVKLAPEAESCVATLKELRTASVESGLVTENPKAFKFWSRLAQHKIARVEKALQDDLQIDFETMEIEMRDIIGHFEDTEAADEAVNEMVDLISHAYDAQLRGARAEMQNNAFFDAEPADVDDCLSVAHLAKLAARRERVATLVQECRVAEKMYEFATEEGGIIVDDWKIDIGVIEAAVDKLAAIETEVFDDVDGLFSTEIFRHVLAVCGTNNADDEQEASSSSSSEISSPSSSLLWSSGEEAAIQALADDEDDGDDNDNDDNNSDDDDAAATTAVEEDESSSGPSLGTTTVATGRREQAPEEEYVLPGDRAPVPLSERRSDRDYDSDGVEISEAE